MKAAAWFIAGALATVAVGVGVAVAWWLYGDPDPQV